MNFNKVFFGGRLSRDPQLRYLPSQVAVVEFGMACNHKFKTKSGEVREEVVFVDCVAFGKTGELINEHLTKGSPLFIEGKLKYEAWEDKSGGGKRSKLLINVDSFQFIGSKQQGDGGEGGQIGQGSRREPGSDDDKQDGSCPF